MIALIAGLLHVALGAYACGDPIDGTKGPGEPCTRTDECQWTLVCSGGICREQDAGVPMDAGQDAGDVVDGAVEDAGLDDAGLDDAGDAMDDAASGEADDAGAASDDAG